MICFNEQYSAEKRYRRLLTRLCLLDAEVIAQPSRGFEGLEAGFNSETQKAATNLETAEACNDLSRRKRAAVAVSHLVTIVNPSCHSFALNACIRRLTVVSLPQRGCSDSGTAAIPVHYTSVAASPNRGMRK